MQITRYKTIEYKEEVPLNLQGFTKWTFTSGPYTGQDFNIFAREFKKYVKKNLPSGAELVNFSKDHYDLSGFIKKEKRFVYFSISDVRFFPNKWFTDILIRTAKSGKDYTGGSNNYTSLEFFTPSVEKLLNKEY